MGREIRRVPPDWEHPRDADGDYISLYDEDYETALQEWIEGREQWKAGEHPYFEEGHTYESFVGGPPMPYDCHYGENRGSYRRRQWSEDEATHVQMYQNVSEGTPVTPKFPSKENLVDYLIENGTFWDDEGWDRESAERFVENEYAPSFVMSSSRGIIERGGRKIE